MSRADSGGLWAIVMTSVEQVVGAVGAAVLEMTAGMSTLVAEDGAVLDCAESVMCCGETCAGRVCIPRAV